MTPATPSLADCATTPLVAVAINGNGDPIASPSITWTAIDPTIASVSASGVVTGQGAGLGRVEAKSSAAADTAQVTVTPVPPNFSIAPDTAIVQTGTTYPIPVAATNCHGASLPATVASYHAIDTLVATVSASGTVTPVRIGRTKVAASVAGGGTDTIVIVVGRPYTFQLDTTMDSNGRILGLAVSGPGGKVFADRLDNGWVATYDLLTRTLTTDAISVGGTPYGISVDPAGNRVWVANESSAKVDYANARTSTYLGATTLPRGAFTTATSPSGAQVFVGGHGSQIWVLDGSTGALLDSVDVDADPFGLAVTPSGTTLFVGHLTSHTIRSVNTTTRASTVFKTLGFATNQMAVSPDGLVLVVASQFTDSLYFLQVSDGTTIAQTAIPTAWGVAFLPGGSEVWVTSLAGKVYRVSATTHAVLDSLTLNGEPNGIAVHPLGWGVAIGNLDGHIQILK